MNTLGALLLFLVCDVLRGVSVYVNSSSEASGSGSTKDSPYKTLDEALQTILGSGTDNEVILLSAKLNYQWTVSVDIKKNFKISCSDSSPAVIDYSGPALIIASAVDTTIQNVQIRLNTAEDSLLYLAQLNNAAATLTIEKSTLTMKQDSGNLKTAIFLLQAAKKVVLSEFSVSEFKNSHSTFSILINKNCNDVQLLAFKLINSEIYGSVISSLDSSSLSLTLSNSNFINNRFRARAGELPYPRSAIELNGALVISNINLENNTFELSLMNLLYKSGDIAISSLNLRRNLQVNDQPFILVSNPLDSNNVNSNRTFSVSSINASSNVFAAAFIRFEGFNYSKVFITNSNFTQNMAPVLLSANSTYSLELENVTCSRNNLMKEFLQSMFPDYSGSIVQFSQGPCFHFQNQAQLSMKGALFFQNKAVDQASGLVLERTGDFDKIYSPNVAKFTKIDRLNCSENIVFSNGQEVPILIQGSCLSLNGINESVTISNSRFINNSIEVNLNSFILSNEKNLYFYHSPCLFSTGNATELVISQSVFMFNKGYLESTCATFGGKAISISSSDFVSNQANANGQNLLIRRSSGALVMTSMSSKFAGVSFQMNSAFRCAAVCIQNNVALEVQTHVWDSTSFSKNQADLAILEISQELMRGSLAIRTSTFEANTALREGVVLSLFRSQFGITFSASDFTNNVGSGRSILFSVRHSFGQISFNTCNFKRNSMNLQKSQPGVGLIVINSNSQSVSISLSLCNFQENDFNDMAVDAGIFVLNSGLLTDDRSTYKSNFVSGFGSVVVMLFQSKAEFRSITFTSQSSVLIGSCFIMRNQAYLLIDGATIQSVNLQRPLFHLETEGARLEVSNSKVDGFSAVKSLEGTILNAAGSSPLNIKINFRNCYFLNGDSFGLSLVSLLDFIANFENCFFQAIAGNSLLARLSEKSKLFFTAVSLKNMSLGSPESPICFFRATGGSYLSIISTVADEFNTCKGSTAINLESSELSIDSERLMEFSFSRWEQAVYLNLDKSLANINRVVITSKPAAAFLIARGLEADISLVEIKLSDYLTPFSPMNTYSQIILCESCGKFSFTKGKITNATFDSNEKRDCSALALINVIDASVQDSTLEFITGAIKGSAVFSSNHTRLSVQRNIFRENKARSMGGAIFISCIWNIDCGADLKGNAFSNNSAGFAGGAVFTSSLLRIESVGSNEYASNKAENGNNYAGSGLRIKLAQMISDRSTIKYSTCNVNENICELNNILPGNQIPAIYFTIHDLYDQQIKSINNSQLIVLNVAILNTSDPIKNKSLEGLTNYVYRADSSNLTALGGQISSALDGEYVVFNETELRSNSSVAYISFSSDFFSNKHYYFPIKISFDNCGRGEFYNAIENTCFECPSGYYSLSESNAAKCSKCPDNAVCEGRDLIKAKDNFWRKDLTTSKIHECHKISKPCLSDYVGKCKDGYEGVACGGCLRNKRRFYREDRSFCRECDEIFPYMILWIFLTLFFLFTFNEVIQPGVREREGKDLALRMLFNHFQTIGYFFAFYIDFPKYLQDFSKVAYAFMSIDFFLTPLECVLTTTSIPHYGLKTLLAFFLLIIIGLIIIFYWSVVGYRKKSDLQEIKDKIKQSAMSLFYLLQPMYIYFCINNLVCREISDGNYYLVYNTDEQCWNKAHILYSILLLFPMLFLFIIIVPFFWLRFMKRNKDFLDEHYVLVWTKFISMGIDLKRCYYWEFLIMLRKGLILVFATSLHYNDVGAVNMCIIIISIFNFLQIYVSPFKTEKLNNLESLSLNACFFSFISALVYKKSQIEESLKHFFFTLILLFNAVFFIYWFRTFSIRFSSFVNILLGYGRRLKVIYNFFFRNKMRNQEIKVDTEKKPNIKTMLSPKFTISKNEQRIDVVKNQFDKKFDDSSEIN